MTGKFDGALGALTRKKAEPVPVMSERPNVEMSESPNVGMPENPNVEMSEGPKMDVRESGPATPAPEVEEKRSRYTTFLHRAMVKDIQRHALETDVPDYAVVEAAVREYLERHKL